MALWDKIRGEFVDIIEWTDSSNDTMVYRFNRMGNEIKYGAKLVVRESQQAVFINEGQLADVYQPGTYTLETQNMPILTTLKGWKYGFNSPFKAEVYFVNTKQFTDLKWGTKNPIMLRDKEFGPIRLRAFGNYCLRISEADKFLKEIVGTDGHFTSDEITDQLRNLIITRFTDLLGESGIPALDLASNYNEISDFVLNKVATEFSELGLKLTKFLVENISLPEEVEKALDKRSSMGVLGDMNRYTQFQAAEAMEDAAQNPGGMAAGGMGMGMGFAMANQMGQAMNQPQQSQQQTPPAQQTPPPLPQAKQFFVAVNGQQQGPFAVSALQGMISGGQLTKETLVWAQGMANWTPSGQVAEISQLFGATPPPLPPQL